MKQETRECTKCGAVKPVQGFHNRTCGTCRRDTWRQNKGLHPIDPRNRGIHKIGYPAKQIRGVKFKIDNTDRKTVEEMLEQKRNTVKNRRKIPRIKMARPELNALRVRMLLEQGGRCRLCQKELGENDQKCVDHCHKTSRVRGVLCRHCNTALGLLGEDPNLMLRMALYIRA